MASSGDFKRNLRTEKIGVPNGRVVTVLGRNQVVPPLWKNQRAVDI